MALKLTLENENRTGSITFIFAPNLLTSEARGYKSGLVQDGVEEERMIISGTDSSGKAIEE
jgi:hypothetical protein